MASSTGPCRLRITSIAAFTTFCANSNSRFLCSKSAHNPGASRMAISRAAGLRRQADAPDDILKPWIGPIAIPTKVRFHVPVGG